MNSNNTPKNSDALKKALKEAVDEITSIDRKTLEGILKSRQNNDVASFIREMGVLEAGVQESFTAPSFEIFQNPLVEISTKGLDIQKPILTTFELDFKILSQTSLIIDVEYAKEFKWVNPDFFLEQLANPPTFTPREYKEISIAA